MSAEVLLSIAGAILVLEGIPWFLSPAGMRKWLTELLSLPDRALRLAGAAAMLLGLFTVWLGKG